MRRIVLLIIILHSLLFTLHSQTMSKVFTTMPDSLLPLLTERNRHDMVDFYNNKMEAKVRNRLGDYAQLDTLTNDYLRLTLSKASTLEMRMLDVDDTLRVVCMIQTVAAPVRDSRVRFFDADWQRLNWIDLPAPSVEDFFAEAPDSVARTMQFAQRSIDDLRLVEIKIDADSPTLTYTLSCQELAEEEKKVVLQYLRLLRYRWTGSQFVRIDS